MIIRRCLDVDLIRKIMTHPVIYEAISEDGAPWRDEYVPEMSGHWYLIGWVNDTPIGLMIYHPVNGVTMECHVHVLPEYREEYAHEFGQQVLTWAWNNLPVHKIVAQIPVIYPNVIAFAEKNGFIIEGVNRLSYMKHGQLHDQIYLGIARYDHGIR